LYKSSIYGRATIWRRWRIRVPTGSGAGVAPTFSIDPPISVNDTTSKFVFEYVSRNWCVSNIAGMPQTFTNDWTSDNDESLLDEWLIELETRWRALHRLGLDYSEDQDEAEREIDKAIARNGGGATLDLVPTSRRDDFIGQYSLGAFPPTPPAGGSSFDRIGPPPGRLGPAPPAQPLLPPPPLPVAAPSQNPAPAGFFNAAERGPPGVRPQVAARFVTPPPPAPLAVPPPDAALLPVRRAPRETPAPIVAADNGSKLWIPSGPLMLQHALDRGLVVPPPTEPPAPELAAEEGPLPEPRVIPQGEPEPPARRAEPLPPSLPAPATPPPRRGRPTDAATLLMEPADPEDMPDMPLIPVPQRRRRPRPLLDE
jgi:hypothetical protein